jgi:TonB family protein
MKFSLLMLFVALAALARVPAAPQGGVNHFSKEGLTFDYPGGWTAADTGNAEMQRVMLRREGTSNVIMVFAQRELITTAGQLYASRNAVTMPYVETIARQLGLKVPPATNESQCVTVSEHSAVGFRMAGRLEQQPTTAEVYTVVLNQRLLHLVHIRADKDEAEGAAAWKALLDTLKVEPPAVPSPEADKIEKIVSGGVLNGKALRKPQPEYPVYAKRARAQGTVVVELTVDEKGDVVSAHAVSGHEMLRGASEEAARRAKFTPTTLCGKPVTVTGVVTYNFVLL